MKNQFTFSILFSAILICVVAVNLEKVNNEARGGDFDFFESFLYSLFGFDSSEEDYNFDNQNITISCKNCTVSVNDVIISNTATTQATATSQAQATTATQAAATTQAPTTIASTPVMGGEKK